MLWAPTGGLADTPWSPWAVCEEPIPCAAALHAHGMGLSHTAQVNKDLSLGPQEVPKMTIMVIAEM